MSETLTLMTLGLYGMTLAQQITSPDTAVAAEVGSNTPSQKTYMGTFDLSEKLGTLGRDYSKTDFIVIFWMSLRVETSPSPNAPGNMAQLITIPFVKNGVAYNNLYLWISPNARFYLNDIRNALFTGVEGDKTLNDSLYYSTDDVPSFYYCLKQSDQDSNMVFQRFINNTLFPLAGQILIVISDSDYQSL